MLARFFHFLICICCWESSSAVTVFVNADAPSGGNGTTWARAYQDLRVALLSAPASSEVWVARGVYSPGAAADSTFPVKNGVQVFGGFVGTETLITQRDLAAHSSVLDGRLVSNHVVTIGVGGGVLDGFTIRNGSGENYNQSTSAAGTAVYASGHNVTLRNCFISDNRSGRWAGSNDVSAGRGAVALLNGAIGTIEACGFFDNLGATSNVYAQVPAASGAAVSVWRSTLIVSASTFLGNKAGNGDVQWLGGGGGFIAAPGGDGGAIFAEESTLTVLDCDFIENRAGSAGGSTGIGGVAIDEDGFSGGGGGAIHARRSTVTIKASTFRDNRSGDGANNAGYWKDGAYTASGSGGQGGALSLISPNATSKIVHSDFIGNATGTGGVGGTTISNRFMYVTIQGGPGGDGGAVWISSPTGFALVGSRFLGNRTGDGGQGSTNGDADYPESLPPGDGGRGGNGAGLLVVGEGKTNTLSVANCVFAGNLTGNGGIAGRDGNNLPPRGMSGSGGSFAALNAGNASTANCTIVYNTAAGTVGGARIASIANSVVWRNADGSGDGVGAQLSDLTRARFSIVMGAESSSTTGNSGDDPRFVNPLGFDLTAGTIDDDYQATPSSSMIDSGSNALVPLDVADSDNDGNTAERLPLDALLASRFVDDRQTPDTGLGLAPIVDRGAYERPQTICPIDLVRNQIIDEADFLAYIGFFDAGAPLADWNADGFLSFEDFDAFVSDFLTGC